MTNPIKITLFTVTDKVLFETWETSNTHDDENMPMVRGFLMDEIEKRYPEQFNIWMGSDDVEKMDHPELFIS